MRIIIVDDDHLVVNALKTIAIANNIDVIATGFSGRDAISLYKKYSPDLILLDIRMDDLSGIDATEEILRFDNLAKVLLITTFNDEEYISKALSLGSKGYILKDNISGIIPAINAVNSGNLVFDSNIVKNFYLNKDSIPRSDIKFSERELEIVFLVSEGFNNKEIAKKLFLSEGTVRNYVSIILEKLNLRDRTQLVVWYYKSK